MAVMDQETKPQYKLFYPAPFPGRGEHVRLLLEEAGVEYVESTMEEYQQLKTGDILKTHQNIPLYAPPYLQYQEGLVLNQTPNILQFLGTKLGYAGDPSEDPFALYRINGLALTALDGFSDEVHGCHHPLGGNMYYEDTKPESRRRSVDYVQGRIPAFLGYCEDVLRQNSRGQQLWLHGESITYADLVLFQCLDGTKHQFPKAMKSAEAGGKYQLVFKHYEAIRKRPNIQSYLESSRRREYGNGIYRYYPELDVDLEGAE